MKTVSFFDSKNEIPVGKILCLGRNYAEHAKELHNAIPTEPVVFLKPSSAVIHDGGTVIIPQISNELHYEVEMVVLIARNGKNISQEQALDHVGGYGVGLDMTLRDVQTNAKKNGLPWSVAKGFDTSAPVSLFRAKTDVPDPHKLSLSLRVNDALKQNGNTSDMIFSVDFLVSYLSTIFTLETGDLIFTGTPEGVGRVNHGDRLEATLESVGTLRVTVN